MRYRKIRFAILAAAIAASCIDIGEAISQTDHNERVSQIPLPTRVILPLAYNINPNPTPDIVVSSGPFDNTKLNTLQSFAETDVSVNPRNPLNFICGDNRTVLAADNVFYTTDGGVSWQIATTIISAGDPVFTHDSLGNGYYCIMMPPFSPTGFGIWKTTNGGVNFVAISNQTVSGAFDKQWVASDQTGGPFTNRMYLSYSDFVQPVRIMFMVSIDGGTGWLPPQVLFGPGYAQGSNIAVGPDGKVFVSWRSIGGTALRTSIDGGLTFTPEQSITAHSEPGSLHSSGRYTLKGDIRVNGFAQLACDLTTGPYRGYIYASYASNPAGPDAADVFLVRSTNNGTTWNSTSPVRVNDDATLFDQWMNDVSVDNQGRVWVMWWDSRNDPANLWTETYAAVSTNGGVSFLPNIKVSNQRFNPSFVKISQGNHSYLGDYQGMSGKTVTFPVWADGREATGGGQSTLLREFTAYLPDYGISFSKPVDSAGQGGSSTNRVRVPLMGPYSGTVNFVATVMPSPAPGTITFNFTPSSSLTLTGSPDSLNITSNVSATVPTVAYTVNVTGTETGGPRLHARSYTLVVTTAIGISGNQNEIPKEFALNQNYPNPFNPGTVISYQLPVSSYVELKVFDISGKEIAVLVNQQMAAGTYKIDWNAGAFPSGVYFYSLTAGDFEATRKMVLLK